MSLVATVTAVLLIGSPAPAPTADAISLGAHAGFLLGNAHRCGIANERVVAAGRLVRDLIAVAARDAPETEKASARFAQFFFASAFSYEGKDGLVPSCKTVSSEFARLERHKGGTGTFSGSSARPRAPVGAGQ